IAYAIGVADPVSVMVDTFGTGRLAPEKIDAIAREAFRLRPQEIIEGLQLRRPVFKQTAAYGHFGRDEEGFTWERTDRADENRRSAGLERWLPAPSTAPPAPARTVPEGLPSPTSRISVWPPPAGCASSGPTATCRSSRASGIGSAASGP